MIKILTTGGTFDKVYFDANSAFSVGEPQADNILTEANITQPYTIESLLRKDSLELNDDDRQLIVDRVIACECKQILITHGTDTMVSTAKLLADSIALDNIATDKTIVILGAMQPAVMRISDAPFNLGFATAAVQFLAAGVYIAMNGRAFPAHQVVKNVAAARFESTD
ncbi:MAG: asparaginase [Cellvibrionaceae bacterium]|nr:asparaginase [Cellvibrionaceae bacterium]